VEVAIGRHVATTVTLILLGLIGCAGYYERVYRQMGRALDADAAALRSFRWERPVLRGPLGEGNAADEVFAALAEWKPLGQMLRDSLLEKVRYGKPLTAAEANAIEAHTPQLRALRAAAQQRWSRTDLVPERGDQMRVPAYPRLLEAALALLADAQNAGADACLQTAADVIRVGQDVVPAAPLEAASVAAQLTALAAPVIARCAARADLASLRRASHELRLLATHPAPTGSCIELEEVAGAMDLRRRAALTDKMSPLHVAKTLLERPKLLAAWSAHDTPSRFRQLTPEHYPDALEEWRREQDLRLQTHPEAAATGDHVLAHLHDDMRGQALLRMLGIGVSTLAERAYRGNLPNQPTGLRDPALSDPYRGQAFNFRVTDRYPELTLWSVGEDFRDDGGSDESNGRTTRDVTLHFPLGPRDAKPLAKAL
jgi:hypothetical protein